MRGKGGIPLLPGRSRGLPDLSGLAAQPAQDVGGLDVLSTLDVLAHVDNAPLELRLERWWRRSRQTSCSPLRQLAEHNVQLSAPLLTDFASDQSAFRLKVPQGTPPL
jgi:hypothetical protein